MSIPAKNEHIYQCYYHRALTDVKPNPSGDEVQGFTWFVPTNEDLFFNVKARRFSGTSATYDIIIYELKDDGTIANVSNWNGRTAGANVYGPTYVLSPGPVVYPRNLLITFTNTMGFIEYQVWGS